MNLRQKMPIQKTWYGLKVMSLQNSHLEAAAPVWWYLETGRLSAVTWGHEGGASMIRGRETRACVFFLSLSLPCENTAERQPRESQEDSPHRNLTMLAPWFQTSSLQKWEKIHSDCLGNKSNGMWNGSPSWPRQEEYWGRKAVSSIQTKVTR